MRRLVTSTFLVSTLFSATAWAQSWPATDPGYAQPGPTGAPGAPEVFGDKGQLVLTSDFDIDFKNWSTDPPGGGEDASGTSLIIAPAMDFFLGKNLSLGGTVVLERYSEADESLLTFKIGPQLGYNLPLGSALSLWPRVGLLYAHATAKAGDAEATGSGLSLTVFAPLLFHPAQHFFVGIGPRLSLDLTSKWDGEDGAKTTVFGLDFTVGGWL